MEKTESAFYGPVTFHGPMFDIHDNQQVIINNGQLTIDNSSSIDNGQLTMDNSYSIDNGQLTIDNSKGGINNSQSSILNCQLKEDSQSSVVNSQLNCQSSIVNCQLDSPDALALLERLRRAGVVDEAWRPVGLSSAEKGVLASYIAARLGIATPWRTFARLWNMRPDTLRAAYNKGMEQKKTARFLERVKGSD